MCTCKEDPSSRQMQRKKKNASWKLMTTNHNDLKTNQPGVSTLLPLPLKSHDWWELRSMLWSFRSKSCWHLLFRKSSVIYSQIKCWMPLNLTWSSTTDCVNTLKNVNQLLHFSFIHHWANEVSGTGVRICWPAIQSSLNSEPDFFADWWGMQDQLFNYLPVLST